MKHSARIAAFTAALAVSACGGSVKHTVTHVSNASQALDHHGIAYTLPKTLVRVKVPVTRTEVKAGQFFTDVQTFTATGRSNLVAAVAAGDAARTLELNSFFDEQEQELFRQMYNLGLDTSYTAGQQVSLKFKIGSPVVETKSVQDEDQVFFVKVKSGSAEDTLLSMAFTEAGLLSSVSSEREDRSVDLALKSIESLAGLATTVAGFGAGTLSLNGEDTAVPNPYSKGLEILGKVSDLEGKRNEALSLANAGAIPLDTLKYATGEYDKKISQLLAYFVATQTSEWAATMEYDPVSLRTTQMFEAATNATGKVLGLCHGASALITPVPSTFAAPTCPASPSANLKRVSTRHVAIPGGASVMKSVTFSKEAGDKGLRYRIPQQMQVDVTFGNSVLARTDVMVAQLGPVAALPAEPGGKKSKLVLELFAATGAPKKVEVQSTGASASTIESAGAAGQALAGIKTAADSREKNALTEEVEILRLQKEKKELEDALLKAKEDEPES